MGSSRPPVALLAEFPSLRVVHLNVSAWGPEVVRFFENTDAHVVMFCEHHLAQVSSILSAKAELAGLGWYACMHPAVDSDSLDRPWLMPSGLQPRPDGTSCRPSPEGGHPRRGRPNESPDLPVTALPELKQVSWECRPGVRDKACSAGVGIAWRSHLDISPLDSVFHVAAYPTPQVASRLIHVSVRVKGCTFMLTEVYNFQGREYQIVILSYFINLV